MPKKLDLTQGMVFGDLTVASRAAKNGRSGRSYYNVICACGNASIVSRSELVTGKTKSCGCLRVSTTSRLFRNPAINVSFNNLYTRCAKSARGRGIAFDLTLEEHTSIVTQNCHYCGTAPAFFNVYLSVYSKKKRSNMVESTISAADVKVVGVDRVDSSEGYSIGNCVPCCSQCNTSKLDYSEEEFIAHCHRVVANHKSRKGAA